MRSLPAAQWKTAGNTDSRDSRLIASPNRGEASCNISRYAQTKNSTASSNSGVWVSPHVASMIGRWW